MKTLSMVLLALLAFCGPALAAGPTADDLHTAYASRYLAYKSADIRMNTAWKKLRAVCTQEEFKAELDRQRQWLKEKNARLLRPEHASERAEAWAVAKMVNARIEAIERRTQELALARLGGCADSFQSMAHRVARRMDLAKLHRAAEAGDASACFALYAVFSGYGVPGVERDEERGLEWLRLAFQGGSPEARYLVATGADQRLGFDLADGERESLLENAYEDGVLCAAYHLGVRHGGGEVYPNEEPPTPLNREKARMWYERSVEAGYRQGWSLLALSVLERDPDLSTQLLRKAAEVYGESDAMMKLSDRYQSGKGADRDMRQAGEWFERFFFFREGDEGVVVIPHICVFTPLDLADFWFDEARDPRRAALWYDYMFDIFSQGRGNYADQNLAELAEVYSQGRRAPKDLGKVRAIREALSRGSR